MTAKKSSNGLGASAKKPSRSTLQSSAKKRKDLRSDRSRAYARAGVWYDVNQYLPAPRGQWMDTQYVLCEMEYTPAVVCFYLYDEKMWRVADHRANDEPVKVTRWRLLPDSSDGTKHPTKLFAVKNNRTN